MPGAQYDLLVIGGGINGAGIARDAAGRGLSVLLVEARDLASASSSTSSKLIHGGLRYLEHCEFRLVASALAERETLLRVAAHLVSPLHFVMPHVPQLRPRWMIRLGLFLYDHLARRSLLPGSRTVRLDASPYGNGLRPELMYGFVYSDCKVDDARLVVANALDAATRGARVLVGTECLAARRNDGLWLVRLSSGEEVSARAIANAAGPWVKRVLNDRLGQPSSEKLRLVQGSHIVLPRLYEGEHAFLLQNDDRRVVFLIPFEDRYTLVGTTDLPLCGDPAAVQATDAEVQYLCRAASRYLTHVVRSESVLWRYAGVRPLYDDGTTDPSAITRDYSLHLHDQDGGAPVLSVFGGKITTYRRLSALAMDKLAPYFPGVRGSWTERVPLPGSNFASRAAAFAALRQEYPHLAAQLLQSVFQRHGALAAAVLGDGNLGEHYGAGLTEREVRYFIEHEWARSAEDVLWRRTKAGLHLTKAQQARVKQVVGK